MNKRLSLMVRLVLAVAGIAYIAFGCVDWVSVVEVKPGTTLPSGRRTTKVERLRVTGGDVDPGEQTADLILRDEQAPERVQVVKAADLRNPAHYLVRPSIVATIHHADKRLLVLGLLLVAIVYPIQTFRWLILLRCRGLEVTYAKAFKLTMIGCFFNYCMPGSTGGDVVKAYYAAARSERRADAIMTVFFDRVTGLLGLVALAAVASLFMLHMAMTRTIAIWLWSGSAVGAVMSVVYFSRRLRRRLGVNWVLARLPFKGIINAVDQAAVAYRDHKMVVLSAVLMSVPVHLALTGATAIAGYAVGMSTPPAVLMMVVAIIFLSGTFPITPQGAGVWEIIGGAMLVNVPGASVTMNQVVAMLLIIRVYQLVYSLLGSAFLFRGDVHLHPPVDKAAEAVIARTTPVG